MEEPEILEMGTSLAEEEHGVEGAPSTIEDSLHQNASIATSTTNDVAALRSEIASDVLATGTSVFTFASPFEVPHEYQKEQLQQPQKYWQVPMVYCDQTASNRTLNSIESYMKETCLPYYGNTHTNTSITGAQSTAFVAEARQIVAEGTNARIAGKASLDVVLFAGSGTTAAVELLIDCLGLKYACNNPDQRPVVFVGPYEHHSNLLPWRESGCEIVTVPECPQQHTVDYAVLERLLQNPSYKNRMKMGTFTAASNVTGKVSDVDRIAAVLHRHGALAFFDYATGAPYMSMDMNPSPSDQYPTPSLVAKDAIFLSPHKMIGGIGTPGVLVIKKHLIDQENAPSRSGGGTVFYVTNTHHRFLSNRIDRYEGGTPNVAGILRVGLAFLFKRQVEQKYVMACEKEKKNDAIQDQSIPPTLQLYEYSTYDRVSIYLKHYAPNLHLLGYTAENNKNPSTPNLPIFSFLIKCGNRFLHYNYVCAILNDVFGIQSRGGCQCAGPYSQRLLGLTKLSPDGQEVPNERNEAIEHALLHYKERAELLRPGYTRLSLPFKGLRDEEVEYVMKALAWTAKHGWALMCNYRCNYRTGEWRHANRQGRPLGRTERKWLSYYSMSSSVSSTSSSTVHTSIHFHLEEALANADVILNSARSDKQRIAEAIKMNDIDSGSDLDRLEYLRWYVHPKECAPWLLNGMKEAPGTDSLELEGGLLPQSFTESPSWLLKNDATRIDSPSTSPSQPSDRKRKKHTTQEAVVTEVNSPIRIPGEHVINFRDGDHAGQAPLRDIEMGFDDEELSALCQVYHPQKGEWIEIEAFLEGNKNESSSTPVLSLAEKRSGSEHTENVLQNCFPANGGPDVKNERKKPSRGCTAWGQGSFPPATAVISTNVQVVKSESISETKHASEAAYEPSPEHKKTKKNNKFKHVRPPPKMMRLITQAIIQWNMLEDGDRLLLGLSGGKDSLSLLHCLLECKRKLPIQFEIEVCTIDPMTPSFDPSPLIPYVESLGLKYHYIRDNIVDRANAAGKDGKMVSSLCSFCARMKRGNLYTCARSNKCNKLVLAQHLDDCAESFFMSVMHNGFLRTMKAHYKIDAGDLSVIRPMIYCRESLMTTFAKSANLPVINENCPACFEEPKERARTKKLLAREESLYPHFHDNIRRSLIPLMHNDMASILRGYTEEAVSRSRKEPHNGKKKQSQKEAAPDARDVVMEGANETSTEITVGTASSFANFSDDQLMMELAMRKANRYHQPTPKGDKDDPTGQVCTLNGGNGTIPCRELME